MMADFEDWYAILEVSSESTPQEIVKAYRKKALIYHPDKNKNDPSAHEKFVRISKALEVLTDESAKAAFDRVVKAKAAALARRRQLDVKRQKLKDELEERERAAFANDKDEQDAERAYAAEVERLRKEGSAKLKEEQERIRRELEEQSLESDTGHHRLRLRWKANTQLDTESELRSLLLEFGSVDTIVMSTKGRSALVEYHDGLDLLDADRIEEGLRDQGVSVKWLTPRPRPRPNVQVTQPKPKSQSAEFSDEFENAVLAKLREAQARKQDSNETDN